MPQYHPHKLLVTGGAGFIGSNFIHYLLRQYKDVTIVNLDALTYAGNQENLNGLPDPGRHQLMVGNICDVECVANLLRTHDIDTIVHFAAESHVDRSIDNPDEFVQSNVLGTMRLLVAAQRYWLEERHYSPEQCRFHHISTDEVYGQLSPVQAPFTEQTPYDPSSPYSASKAAADHFVRAAYRTYGLGVTLSNCSNNYGPRQHVEKFIPLVIKCCLNGQRIPIYGSGENIRDWIFVDDHCQLLDQVIRHGALGQSYNIGAQSEHTNMSLATLICQIMEQLKPGKQPYADLITHVIDRKGHDFRHCVLRLSVESLIRA